MLFGTIAASSTGNYSFYRYGIENGLAPTVIEDIRRCSEGYVWMATWSGIYRFDGEEFLRYTPERTPVNERFTRIEADDANGRLWAMGYDGELFSLDKASGEMQECGGGRRFVSMFRLDGDEIMLVSDDGWIYRAGRRAGRETGEPPLSQYLALERDFHVNDMFKDSNGRIYVLCDKGIFRDRELLSAIPAFCHLNMGNSLYIGSTGGRILLVNEKGEQEMLHTGVDIDIRMLSNIPAEYSILMGSADEGIFRFSPESGAEALDAPFAQGEFRTARGAEGELWIYSKGGSLSRFDPRSGEFSPFYDSSSQKEWGPENRLEAFLCDSQDILWIAGGLRGLERACKNDTPFRVLAVDGGTEPSSENSVRAIFRASGGLNYVATKDGRIHVYDEMMNSCMALWTSESTVLCFTQDHEGTVWMGTDGDGIAENTASYYELPEFRPSYYRGTPEFHGSNADHVHSLCTAPDGRIWIGSFDGGLSYLDPANGQRHFISRKNGLTYPADMAGKIRQVCMSPDGKTLYAAGTGGILSCPDPSGDPERIEFKWFGNVSGMDIQHLMFSSSGQMYVSTYGSGFLRLDPYDRDAPYKVYTISDGLPSNYVLSSVEDFRGNIWIVTETSLCRLNPETESIIRYPTDRILPNMLLNEGEPLCVRDGLICIGTNCGVLYFNPAEISNSTYSPKLMVTSAFLNGTRIQLAEGKATRLTSRDRLSLRVKAIDMEAPERVMYSYRMGRRHGEWKSMGTSDALVLENLRPGTYSLTIRSTNADGFPAHNDITFAVRVSRSLVWTAAAALAMLAATAALLIFLHSRKKAAGSGGAQTAAIPDPFTLKLNRILTANLDNADFSLEDICREMGMSRNTLYDRCRSRMGTTPSVHFSELRLQKAAQLLREAEYGISQIAYMTGFNDSHYFSRAFRKRFGTSPSEYRRNCRG